MGAFGNRHQRKGRKGQNRHPLRRVVASALRSIQMGETHYYLPGEKLECGHVVPIKSDFVGATNAVRRRCRECGRAGAPPRTGRRFVSPPRRKRAGKRERRRW